MKERQACQEQRGDDTRASHFRYETGHSLQLALRHPSSLPVQNQA